MTAWGRIVVFAILRFSPEIKNEVKCFSMNIQYSTELKDRVQIKDGKNKNVKRIYKWKVFVCVCVLCCVIIKMYAHYAWRMGML